MNDICGTSQDPFTKPRMCRSMADDAEIALPGLVVIAIALVAAWLYGRRR